MRLLKERKRRTKKRNTSIILLLFLLLAIATAGYFGFRLWNYDREYRKDQQLYEDLREAVLQITDEVDASDEPDVSDGVSDDVFDKFIKKFVLKSDAKRQQTKKKKDKEDIPPFEVDWTQLKEINKDIIGWVYFTGVSQISYPVLQAKDNAYYVNRTYDLSSDTSKAGSIFMDYRMASDFSSPYSIIYGHNVRDGSMLSDLTELRNQDLYDTEPYFWILTPDGNYCYRVFSVFQCHRSADVFQRSFDHWGADFSKWQSELQMRNCMKGDMKLEEYGHVILFSTCVPNSFDRTIVCGTYIDGDPIPDPHGK